MKFALFAIIVTTSFIACNQSEKTESSSMAGAYKMTSVVLKSDKTDTTDNNPNQFKIYTEDHMMYANVNPADSVSSFGVGTFSMDKDTLTENVFYSAGDSATDDTARVYKLHIQILDNGYKQLIAGMTNSAGEKFNLTESYSDH